MIIKDYFLGSNLHGFNYIPNKQYHWTERVLWIIFIVFAWICSIIFTYKTFYNYQKQLASLTVDTSYLNWQTNFPSIVFCERINNKVGYYENEWFSGQSIKFQSEMIKSISFYKGLFDYKEICDIDSFKRKDCLMGNFSYYMTKLRSRCNEIFNVCIYNGITFNCCDEFLPIHSYYGTCYAINNKLTKDLRNYNDLPFKITSNGYGMGNLTIELLTENVIIFGLSQDAAPSIRDNKHILLQSDSNAAIKRGKYYTIYLSVQETYTSNELKDVEIEKRMCRFNEENNLNITHLYSLSNCNNECLIKAHELICNCVLHTFDITNSTLKECNLDGLICIHKYENQIINYTNNCKCINSCSDVVVNFVGGTQKKLNKNEFILKESVVKFSFLVYPPSLRYTRLNVKNSLDITVSIGGIGSVFLGASILSLIEIIYYFLIKPFSEEQLLKNKNKKKMWKFFEKQNYLPYID